MSAGAPRRHRFPGARLLDDAKALDQHQEADGAEKHDICQRDEEFRLADLAEESEQQHAHQRADDTAGDQYIGHAEIDIAPAPLGERARD
jgi:antitoxin component of MazEF toxin-antitoxin module